ncbi:DNA primase [Dysgonomonas sp. 25]|uniref:DNA primase n=1 Tax=Dysgonomonas sp. 25 TaxID=2302933 RepID=UPI0013D49291|nr:DNA primase [Dysgonomonas sp. 25]NDV68056.1 DNA primase [Dysgonomonas sp. 25]
MIDRGTIDRIINAADIVDVVSQFVNLKRRGVNYVGLCPFHEDKTPSFYVSPSKNICKCFSCGEGGTSVHFIMKHEQLSYVEALRYLAKKYNIEVQERELSDEEKEAYNERESLFILNEYARDYFVNILHNHIEGKTVGLSYFEERGFREDIIRKFQLGYCLEERDAFTQEALKAGYKKDYLVKTGLTFEANDNSYLADRFRGRVMFPIHTISGKVVGFGGRILKMREKVGKYVNSPESEIYHKASELYGLYLAKQAITKNDCCYLVEGYTDVISMHQAGIENVVASSGTALTPGQIKLIHRFTSNVTVIYDGDAAGIKAALRGIDLLLEQGMNIKVVLLPEGEDPDSFARKQNATSLNKYISDNEVDFIRFKTQLLLGDAGEDPTKRASLITDIVNSISVIPDNIMRSVYIKDCSRLMEIDEQLLVREVSRKRRAHLDHKYTDSQRGEERGGMPLAPPEEDYIPQIEQNRQQQQAQKKGLRGNPIHANELKVLYFVIRYGTHMLIEVTEENPDAQPMNVIQYVKLDLENDGLWFTHPTYKQIFEEAVEQLSNTDFVPSRYFLAHPDPGVSRIAAELVSDRHELSKIHIKQFGENVSKEDTPLAEENHLTRNVPWVLAELKNAYIEQRIAEVNEQLKEKEKAGDYEAVLALMAERKNLKDIKKILDKYLGERIVLSR